MASEELQSIQKELQDVHRILAHIGGRLANVTQRSENEVAALESVNLQLRTDHFKLLEEHHILKQQRDELRDMAEANRPEVENAVQARNDAFKRLRNTRRFLKDILQERRDGIAFLPDGGDDETSSQRADYEAEREHLMSTLLREGSSSSSSSPRAPSQAASERTIKASSSNLMRPRSQRSSSNPPASNASSSPELVRNASPLQGISSPNIISENRRGPKSHWRINFSRPPRSARIIPMGDIQSELHLDNDEFARLESLGDCRPDGYGLRIEIIRDYAFVHDPIFLETKDQTPNWTMLIDWASSGANSQTARAIMAGRGRSPNFHLFSFSSHMATWYYFGAYSWRISLLGNRIWSTFSERYRNQLLSRMQRHVEGVSEEEILRRLDDEELEQFSIRLQNEIPELQEMTNEFITNLSSE
ncbi:hypothetical protein HGRIS_009400 [Hohenbuehelia grisea]|uniref:Uncharacterized protein n=1 Tax=Hohenbuehelia grisea TaxID=104357 RepID=A0ABR3J107_9AGAR